LPASFAPRINWSHNRSEFPPFLGLADSTNTFLLIEIILHILSYLNLSKNIFFLPHPATDVHPETIYGSFHRLLSAVHNRHVSPP